MDKVKREILFRGKRENNSEWVEGNLFIPDLPDSPTQICIGTNYTRITYDIIPETMGQYTGLTDKNGTKIFEGDIVRTKYGRLCIVVWFSSPVCNGWDLEPIMTNTNLIHPAPTQVDIYRKDNLEVVGNIHDNSELLGEHSL